MEGPGSVGGVKTRTVGAGENIVVLLVAVVLIVVETVVVLCAGVGFGLGMVEGCCRVVRRGIKKL